MKIARVTLLAIVALTLGVPSMASAEHCTSNIVIFSTNSNLNRAVNSNAATCLILEHDADSRLINPGSDIVSVRFTLGDGTCQVADPENGTSADTLEGTLDGLGVEDLLITLTCRYDATLDFYSYNTIEWVSIDPAATGCITAAVEGQQNSFHTLGTLSCPDGGF